MTIAIWFPALLRVDPLLPPQQLPEAHQVLRKLICVIREVQPGKNGFVPASQAEKLVPGERSYTGTFISDLERIGANRTRRKLLSPLGPLYESTI